MSSIRPDKPRQAGISLVEVIVFIVVVGVALAGVLGALNVATRYSADPLVQKQALAIAEALLEEIELMPFTYCDPDDANAANAGAAAVGVGNCTTTAESLAGGGGPEASENRYGPAAGVGLTPFDNVNDYNGFTMVGITTITNTVVPGLDSYTATVAIVPEALGVVPNTASVRIRVQVTGPAGVEVILEGMRTRYAPNALP